MFAQSDMPALAAPIRPHRGGNERSVRGQRVARVVSSRWSKRSRSYPTSRPLGGALVSDVVADAMPNCTEVGPAAGTTVGFRVYVEDCDLWYGRAVAAG